jgi:hypothetical protein
MQKHLEQKLVERWPAWFNTEGDIRCTAMARGFEHGDGWFDILWRLCEDLEPLVTEIERAGGPKFEVLQVKEKLGGLRIYVNRHSDAIERCLGIAADESFRTCEVCGQPGRQRGGGWIKTLCDEHTGFASDPELLRELGFHVRPKR